MLRYLLRRPPTGDEESWGEVGIKLTRAVLALAQAEASGLQKDIQGSWSTLRGLLIGLVIGLGLSVFAVALLLVSATLGLSQVMHPAWAALLVGAVLGVIALFWLVRARRAAAQLETPAQTVYRRVNNHLDWWKNEVKSVARPDSGQGQTQDDAGRPDVGNSKER